MATRLTTILVAVIVGATFIAGLIVGAQRDDASVPVDLIIVNGKVYPGGGADLEEAIAVRGNQILRVGSNREVKRLRRAQTVVLDAHGATVIPGLNDSHVQLMAGALALEQLDLSSVKTIDDLTTELRHYAASSRRWVLGRNGDAELFAETTVPARKILDEAVQDRPIFLTSDDGTIAWANSKALTLAGIDRRTRNPELGLVAKERRTGEPTGMLQDAAIDLVARVLPQPTRVEKIAALRAAMTEAHKLGITSVQTVNAGDEELRLLDEIRQQGNLAIRVYGSIAVSPAITEAAVAELNTLRQEYPDDPILKLGGVEIVCAKRGRVPPDPFVCDPAQLERAIAVLDSNNWHVMVRASDEADVQAARDAFARLLMIRGPLSPGVMIRGPLSSGAATLNRSRERRHRLGDSVFSDGGVRTLSGSDWPADSLDPLEAMEEGAAASGELRNGIDAYTSHAAYASYDEQRKGTLARGMLADIVILSNDILEGGSGSLTDTVVTVTIFDGKIVYQRPAASTSKLNAQIPNPSS